MILTFCNWALYHLNTLGWSISTIQHFKSNNMCMHVCFCGGGQISRPWLKLSMKVTVWHTMWVHETCGITNTRVYTNVSTLIGNALRSNRWSHHEAPSTLSSWSTAHKLSWCTLHRSHEFIYSPARKFFVRTLLNASASRLNFANKVNYKCLYMYRHVCIMITVSFGTCLCMSLLADRQGLIHRGCDTLVDQLVLQVDAR